MSSPRQISVLRIFLVLVLVAAFSGAAWFWHTAKLKREYEEREAIVAAQRGQIAQLRREQEISEAKRAQEAKVALKKLYVRWQDAERLALSTPILSLSGPVASMQSLRREAEEIDIPPCLVVARAKLVSGMARTVNSFLAWMGEPKIAGVMISMARKDAAKDFAFFNSAIENCSMRR